MIERRSIRFRLTVWYGIILTAALGLFGTLLWLSLQNRLIGEVDRDLEGRASRFAQYFRAQSGKGPLNDIRDELEEFCQALPPSQSVAVRGSSGFVFEYPTGKGSADKDARVLRQQFVSGGETFDLELTAPVTDVRHTLNLLRLLLLSLIPLVVVVACAGGAWLSGRALKPVQDVTAAALTISIENLSERLPVPSTGDEVARLTEVLNTMLARLEAAVKTLSQFVADASHELRTPLTLIRTTAELAARRSRTPESYRDSLGEIVAEAERMTVLVEDLLTLARSDVGTARFVLAPMDVRDVLRDVMAGMQGLAGELQIPVKAAFGEEPAIVSASRPALHRLFLLLIDNALKFSRPGGEVVVVVETGEHSVSVSVEDFGVGISEADLPNIFKRFYRTDQARSGGGHGLGLSLAESITRMHGATIEVQSKVGLGSVFRVVFPARGVQAELTPEAAPEGTRSFQ